MSGLFMEKIKMDALLSYFTSIGGVIFTEYVLWKKGGSLLLLIISFIVVILLLTFLKKIYLERKEEEYKKRMLEALNKKNYDLICEDFFFLSFLIESETGEFYNIKKVILKKNICYFITIEDSPGSFDLSKIKDKNKIIETFKLLNVN